MSDTSEMTAQLLSGTAVAKRIKEELAGEVKELTRGVPRIYGFKPSLGIIQFGNHNDSNVIIKMKLKVAFEIGIKTTLVKLKKSATQSELISKIRYLNNEPSIHGITLQIPLESDHKIDLNLAFNSISPEKDVDGLHTLNQGRIAIGDLTGVIPCAPSGIIKLIKESGIGICGSEAVVLGRSKTVGTPVAHLLKWHNATVTICHKHTVDIQKQVSRADILVVAIGQPEFVKGSWVKKGAIVIDCGRNYIKDPTKKGGQRLVGDVAFDEVKHVAAYLTPVPGGVGPMTIAMLMKNTVLLAQRSITTFQLHTDHCWSLTPLKIDVWRPIQSDVYIARNQQPKDIDVLAHEIGILKDEVILYGKKKAKLSLSILKRLADRPSGKYIIVTGITPTPLGEGITTTTIGLVQALTAHLKKNAIACMRRPSQGHTFGVVGGGYSQVIPMDDYNLHLNGDIYAITAVNHFLAAELEARMMSESTQSDEALFNQLVTIESGVRVFSECQLRRLEKLGIEKQDPGALNETERKQFSRLNIDPETLSWSRVIDSSECFLHKITIGQLKTEKSHTIRADFTKTVAISCNSDIMAILALAKNLQDLKTKLSKIVLAFNTSGQPVTADDLGVTRAITDILKGAMEPTLMQSLEGTPVFVHSGPYSNIAHGCSSVVADSLALKLVGPSGYTVTEAGLGSDIGMEKVFHIKCRNLEHKPNVVVIVTTVRALKMHGGGPQVVPGRQLSEEYTQENLGLVEKGLTNLRKHIRNAIKFGVPVIVAINHFWTDTEAESELIKKASLDSGAKSALICTHWENGGQGAIALGKAVIEASSKRADFRFLYDLEMRLIEKIEIIAKKICGAGTLEISDEVTEKLKQLELQGFGNLPVNIFKTIESVTGDPSIKGAPVGFILPIVDVVLSAGAGFIVAVVGKISRTPSLSTQLRVCDIDLNADTGEIEGLF